MYIEICIQYYLFIPPHAAEFTTCIFILLLFTNYGSVCFNVLYLFISTAHQPASVQNSK